MPPAMSDDESDREDSPDNIPAREIADAPMADADDADDDDDDDGEDGEEVYQVEAILEHKFLKGGVLQYKIKWLGYDEESDMTWEPVDNLDGSEELVKAYHISIGGTPERGSTKKIKGGKRTASEAFDSPAPGGSQKKKGGHKSVTNGGTTEEFDAPIGSWEDHVVKVAAIIEIEEPGVIKKGTTDIKSLKGLLEWSEKHGSRKTEHSMAQLRKKCPQRLLDYYESHLKFVD